MSLERADSFTLLEGNRVRHAMGEYRKCHSGQKRGPRYHLAVMEDGKQRQHYIRMAHKELALQGLAHDRIIEEILQEITSINLELMKEGAYDNGQPGYRTPPG